MSQLDASQVAGIKEQTRRDWSGGAAAWRKWNPQYIVQTRAATAAIIKGSRRYRWYAGARSSQ